MYPPLPEEPTEATKSRWKRKKRTREDQFIQGPIPLEWICGAARLAGKPLVVALAIAYKAGLARGEQELAIGSQLLERFGVSRRAGYRGLDVLQQAGLITLDRKRGRCARVRILKPKGQSR